MSNSVFFSVLLLLSAVLAEPIARKLRLPLGIVLVTLGFIISKIVIDLFGIDTGLRWHNLDDIVLNIILPIVVFRVAIEIDVAGLWADIIPLSLLSLPLMLVSVLIITVFLFYGVDHAVGFPWIAALITGALLSATEPSAVLFELKKNNAPKRLSLLLEGESLMNSTTAIVLFTMFVALGTGMEVAGDFHIHLAQFTILLLGGLAYGLVTGLLACLIMKLGSTNNLLSLTSIICAYVTFTSAEYTLHVSGIMAVLSSGLLIGAFNRRFLAGEERDFTNNLWHFFSHVAESIIFLLAGVTLTLSMFSDRWLAIMLGIIAVIVARAVMIFGIFPFLNKLPFVKEIPIKQQTVLVWGGIKGTVTLALALSLPTTLDYWYTVQSIAYGVVFFTLFVQATTIGKLINRFKLT